MGRDSRGKGPRKNHVGPNPFPGLILFFALGLGAAIPVAFLVESTRGQSSPPQEIPRGPKESPKPQAPPAARSVRAPSSASREVDFRCARAYELMKAERYSEAFEELSKAAMADPTDARPLIGMAEIYRALDYDERAEHVLRKAVELEPSNSAARVSLAMVLCDFGKNREALEILEALEKERPEDPFIWAEIAINAVRLGDPKAAIPLLERYNAKAGKQAWGYENLGRAHFEAGNFEAAEKCLREAIAINPKTPLAHLWLGHLLTAQGRHAEAKAPLETFRQLRILQTQARLLEQAINRTPDEIDYLVRLAHVRTLLGKHREALVPLERALELSPHDDRLKRLVESVRARAKEEAQ